MVSPRHILRGSFTACRALHSGADSRSRETSNKLNSPGLSELVALMLGFEDVEERFISDFEGGKKKSGYVTKFGSNKNQESQRSSSSAKNQRTRELNPT